MSARTYAVIVIGGGHAGAEAAWAAANMLRDTDRTVAMVTLRASTIGAMSCNPAIGGIAKGQMVCEIDAMGGLMGEVADETGLMFKLLNTSKGPAVQSPRCQSDKLAYSRAVQRRIAERPEIEVIEAPADRFIIEGTGNDRCITGVVIGDSQSHPELSGSKLNADAVVLTTGTFMRGLMHTGESQTPGGRTGEAPATTISDTLRELGFELGRLRTGTPPRLRKSTIDWESLDLQVTDDRPTPFSALSTAPLAPLGVWTPPLAQLECRVTHTTEAAHELIRANVHRAPMYMGHLAQGPRYCPSIEDKAVRFADRSSHHVFLEPESHETDWVYCNGIATSLPADIQDPIVHSMPGCERAEILQWGYAVEYDMVRPHQINAACMTRSIQGLFLAGQINGTSGYEEAAGQGLIAGINAVRWSRGERDEHFTLGRDQAFIGVMMDDLVTKTPVEPYRMFTSRAEHRLILRADNAIDRLAPIGESLDLLSDERKALLRRRNEDLNLARQSVKASRIEGEPLSKAMKRTGFTVADLADQLGEACKTLQHGVLETVLAEQQYEGYITRQLATIKRHASMERRRIPQGFDYNTVIGLRTEARHRLAKFTPDTLGQAGRLEGVNPADISLVVLALDRHSKANVSA